MDIVREQLDEHVVPGRRLGRHIAHDPRSRAYPAPEAPAVGHVVHATHGLPLDQGNLGSCTGNAAVGLLATEPFFTGHQPTEAEAVDVYSQATHLDGVRGVYPPTDTGSSGLAVMKALHKAGLVAGYAHCFGLDHTLRTLTLQPVIVGVGWREGMDTPDPATGVVRATGQIRGGHEFLLYGVDTRARHVLAMNSWGVGWGRHGTFRIPWADLDALLADRGDATTAIKGA